MIGLLQGTNKATVAEDEYADRHEEPEWYWQHVERHFESAVGGQQTVF